MPETKVEVAPPWRTKRKGLGGRIGSLRKNVAERPREETSISGEKSRTLAELKEGKGRTRGLADKLNLPWEDARTDIDRFREKSREVSKCQKVMLSAGKGG